MVDAVEMTYAFVSREVCVGLTASELTANGSDCGKL